MVASIIVTTLSLPMFAMGRGCYAL